jgi:tetratricopeptide (TPR) repeat protein
MSRIGVALMAAALLVYLAVAVWLAVMFFAVGSLISIGMGVALIVLAPLGGWALLREMQFGLAADRLGRTLDAEGGMPEAEGELTPSGRIAASDVEPMIARYAEAANESPADWRARYRLGVVQDAAGRRKDARTSIREAIRLARG